MQTRREIAENLVRDAFGTPDDNPIHAVAGRTIAALTDAIEASLKDRDEQRGESAWLLEKMYNGQVWYIKADYVLEWTDDPLQALRLARREDAEALSTIAEDCEKIAAHEWVPSAIRRNE